MVSRDPFGAVIVYIRQSIYPKLKEVENVWMMSTFDRFYEKPLPLLKRYKIADLHVSTVCQFLSIASFKSTF